jgi:hypothetical protein
LRSGRLLAAESALIARSAGLVGLGDQPNRELPRQPLLRALLKDGSKPIPAKVALLQMAMEKLLQLSKNVTESGFDFVSDFEMLCDVYSNFDTYYDEGFCGIFVALMVRSLTYGNGTGETISKKEMANLAIESISGEINRLFELLKKIESNEVVFASLASLLLPQPDLDRIIRYESHISREFDRELNQLERLQRTRRGPKDLHRAIVKQALETASLMPGHLTSHRLSRDNIKSRSNREAIKTASRHTTIPLSTVL